MVVFCLLDRRSRSYSRSRSRSGSLDRRDRRRWGGGGSYYRPRFNNNRGRFNRGGYRDFRGRDRWGNRGNRWGGGGAGGGGRFRFRRNDSPDRRFRRSRSRSFDSPDRKRSPVNDRERSSSKQGSKRRSPQPPSPPKGDAFAKTNATGNTQMEKIN